ncbi:MAG: hypothetical protein A2Z20_08975 [Bdellovibrionales bacterium RBG_16_40_8]|nr:MAG: hypothetical protein A2Z20_08975 [Bdellovibrionales bacterium RBG_16_40_8]
MSLILQLEAVVAGKIPNFNYPTIAEALCEIHFQTEDGGGLSSTGLDALSDVLKSDFPTPKDQELQQFEAVIGSNGVSVKPVGTPTKKRMFKHRTRDHLIQVSQNILTINELNAYPGWKIFEPDIYFSIDAICKVAKISQINRIGLRYINKVPRDPKDAVGSWLKENAYYPNGILKYTHKFASRFEFRHDSEVRAIVSIAEGQDDKGNQPILFDIDCIIESELPMNKNKLSPALDRVHNLSWDVFGNSLTERYKSYLEKGS